MSSRWRVDFRPRVLMNSWKRASLSLPSAFRTARLPGHTAGDHLAQMRLDVERFQVAGREEREHRVDALGELGIGVEKHDVAAAHAAGAASHRVSDLTDELFLAHLGADT